MKTGSSSRKCTVEIVISEQWSWKVAWFLKEHYCPARNHTTLHDHVLLVTFTTMHCWWQNMYFFRWSDQRSLLSLNYFARYHDLARIMDSFSKSHIWNRFSPFLIWDLRESLQNAPFRAFLKTHKKTREKHVFATYAVLASQNHVTLRWGRYWKQECTTIGESLLDLRAPYDWVSKDVVGLGWCTLFAQ